MAPILMAITAITSSGIQEKTVEAFWSVEHKIGISGGVDRQEDRLYLFKGGVAVRGFYQQGIDALDLAKIKADKSDFHNGSWTKTGSKLTIRWGGGANPQTFVADKANYTGGGMTWRTLKKVDGARLSGLFAREDPKNDGAQLMLKADGTFAFRNVHRVNLIDLSKSAPENGAGKYVIRNWTIYLKFENGQTPSLSFELPHTEDAKSASFIYLATQNFHRWPGELVLPAEKVEAIGRLTLRLPEGWIRRDDELTGATTLTPPNVPPDVKCFVTITRAQDHKGDAADWHRSIWVPLSGGSKDLEVAKSETVGPFLRSKARLDRPVGGPIWIAVYSLVSEGKGIAALFMSESEALFAARFEAVEKLMAGAKGEGSEGHRVRGSRKERTTVPRDS